MQRVLEYLESRNGRRIALAVVVTTAVLLAKPATEWYVITLFPRVVLPAAKFALDSWTYLLSALT